MKVEWMPLNFANVMIVAVDLMVYDQLSAELPGRVMLAPQNLQAGTGAANFGTGELTKITGSRPWFILHLLQVGLNVLYVDADAQLLKDPFLQFADVVDMASADDDIDSSDPNKSRSPNLCSGLLFARPTPATKKFMETWFREMSPNNDQIAYNAIYQRMIGSSTDAKAAPFKVKVLNINLFPPGPFYFEDLLTPEEKAQVYMIHNNYIVGHDAKVSRFKSIGF